MDSCGLVNGQSVIITESGTQFLNRLERRNALSDLEPVLFPEDFEVGTVVEIIGEAGIGKSELLLHFVLKCILPISWHDYHLGGFHVGVIFFDNDHHLHLPRLVHLLEETLHSKLSPENFTPSSEEVEQFVMNCLALLRIVRCEDSAQFILTLQYMNAFASSTYNCCVLVIDSVSAFYYEDRMMKSDNLNQLDAYYKQLSNILQRFVENDKFCVFFTQQDLIKPTKMNEEINFMGHDLQKLISWRLSMSKENTGSGIVSVDIRHKNKTWKRTFTISDSGIKFNIQ